MKNLLQEINQMQKNNLKISKAWEIFERSQKIYDQSVNAIVITRSPVSKGTYSSNISKKEYYADISTTTKRA